MYFMMKIFCFVMKQNNAEKIRSQSKNWSISYNVTKGPPHIFHIRFSYITCKGKDHKFFLIHPNRHRRLKVQNSGKCKQKCTKICWGH